MASSSDAFPDTFISDRSAPISLLENTVTIAPATESHSMLEYLRKMVERQNFELQQQNAAAELRQDKMELRIKNLVKELVQSKTVVASVSLSAQSSTFSLLTTKKIVAVNSSVLVNTGISAEMSSSSVVDDAVSQVSMENLGKLTERLAGNKNIAANDSSILPLVDRSSFEVPAQLNCSPSRTKAFEIFLLKG